ncbi:MAG: RHS repeat-associated core domain-containing protein [Rhodanobacter sp.]
MPGQYFDKETNTHYNYFRDYDPAIGRYLQSDLIGLRGGINTYGYVGADPLGAIDSEGLLTASWVQRPTPSIQLPQYAGVTPIRPSINKIGTVSFFKVGVRVSGKVDFEVDERGLIFWTGKLMIDYQPARRVHETTHPSPCFYGRIQTRSNQAGDGTRSEAGGSQQKTGRWHQIITHLDGAA